MIIFKLSCSQIPLGIFDVGDVTNYWKGGSIIGINRKLGEQGTWTQTLT